MYTSTTLMPYLMCILFTIALIIVSEIARKSKVTSVVVFIVLPIILTLFVWVPQMNNDPTGTLTWFSYAKVYSALAGCIGFMAIRFIPRVTKSSFRWWFPPLILAINICEAVSRDFQLSGYGTGWADGTFIMSGPWNIMNGIAGILNIVTICGFIGIGVSKKKSRDMLWPDMMWFWIIAYDLWNFAFTYNNNTTNSLFSGIALLASCTIAAFFLEKGAWLQHRASTLAIYMMFVCSFPQYSSLEMFHVESAQNPAAYFIISGLSLAVNIAVFAYQARTIVKTKRNPLTQEIYIESKGYKEVAEKIDKSA